MRKNIKIIVCFSFILFNLVYSFSQINTNLLINYPFNGDVNDISGNNNDGIPYGVTYGPDRFGNPDSAIYFDGINDYVDFPNLSNLKPNLPVSFSFWIKYEGESFEDQAVFNTSFEEDVSSGVYFNSSSASGNFAINYGDGTYNYTPTTRRTFISNGKIALNSWQFIVIVINSALDMKIYVDCLRFYGVYTGTGGDLFYSSLPGTLGRHDRDIEAPADYFKGAIDDFMYFDRALAIKEIYQLCSTLDNNNIGINLSDIVIYPNPSNNIVNIDTKGTQVDLLTLHNSLGQLINYKEFSSELDVSRLPKGIYYLTLISGNTTEKRKLVIN